MWGFLSFFQISEAILNWKKIRNCSENWSRVEFRGGGNLSGLGMISWALCKPRGIQ